MKCLSPTISLIITTMMVLVVSLTIFYASMTLTDTTRSIMEYGEIKSVFKDIAVVRLRDILQGSRLTYRFSSSTLGIGYKKLDHTLSIIVRNTTFNKTISISDFYSIYGKSNKILASQMSIIYGSVDKTKYIVNDTYDLPLLIEYNENSGTLTELLFNKTKCTVYNVSYSGGYDIVVKLTIPRVVKPRLVSKYSLTVYTVVNETLSRRYVDLNYFKILVNGEEIVDSRTIFLNIGLNPDRIGSFILEIVVYDIYFEVY